jgi:hypothetical protein
MHISPAEEYTETFVNIGRERSILALQALCASSPWSILESTLNSLVDHQLGL